MTAEQERTGVVTPLTLPAIDPDEPIDPNDSTVAVRMSSCRTCPAHTDWIRDDHQERPDLYVWHDEHRKATGHREFHMWTVERNTARIII